MEESFKERERKKKKKKESIKERESKRVLVGERMLFPNLLA